MSWAKFDDRYDDNRKVKRAWRGHPRAVGLHAMSVTYCARHETDGVVDIEWLIDKLPSRVDREKCIVALLGAGLFERIDDEHFQVHDYLEYNDSHAVLGERRARDADRKARGRAKQSERSPRGRGVDVHAESDGPDPTRPDPTINGTSVPDGRTDIEKGDEAAERLDEARERLATAADEIPDDLPSELHEPARQVQQRLLRLHGRKPRSIRPALAAVSRCLASLPDRDHVAVADDVEHYWTFGPGQNKAMRDLVATYRNRLTSSPVVNGASRAGGGEGIDAIVARAERRGQQLERQRREREQAALTGGER